MNEQKNRAGQIDSLRPQDDYCTTCDGLGYVFTGPDTNSPTEPCKVCRPPSAQQPAAQAVGLTDQQIDEIASRWFSAESDLDTIMGFARALLSRAAPSGEPVYDKSVVKRIATQMGWTPPSGVEAALTECVRVLESCKLLWNWPDMKEAITKAITQGRAALHAASQPSAQQAEPTHLQRWSRVIKELPMAEQAAIDFTRSEQRGDWTTFNVRKRDADEAERRLRALLAAPAAGAGHKTIIDNALYCLRKGDTESVENYLLELRGESPTCGDCGGDTIVGNHAEDCDAAAGLHGLTNEQIDRILEGFDRRVLQAATRAQGLTWTSVNDRLPPLGTGERVLIYTEGADFAGEQFFDIKADDLYPSPDGEQDTRTEVAAAATHWMPLPYPGITPNQKDA